MVTPKEFYDNAKLLFMWDMCIHAPVCVNLRI